MNKAEIVSQLLKNRNNIPSENSVKKFAPSNIALCKYWGKRDQILNLPVTSSLSISLGVKGTTTEISINDDSHDVVILNGNPVDFQSDFYKRLVAFLNLIPHRSHYFYINTISNIPTAAGLASSASGFAALTIALDQLYHWELSPSELSILARLGSGSACRSIWQGFVEWHAGSRADGMDSFGEPLADIWSDLRIGLLILTEKEKHVGSRDAMQLTIETSPFYAAWPYKVGSDLIALKQAIKNKIFDLLGKTAESNAMAMHATMMSAWPPVVYAIPETIQTMKIIWKLRDEGLPLYFTQDAGPNLKLLFLQNNKEIIQNYFPEIEILCPFVDK